MNADPTIAGEIADASHILAHLGVFDAFGHVSVRDPTTPDRFLISRGIAPARIRPDDIMVLDLDGNAVGNDDRKSYLERFIHAEIYRARPDVGAVVHSHSPSVIPFGVVSSVPLKPVCHTCGFLAGGTPIFEIRDSVGAASDLLVSTPRLGVDLAARLADAPVVLMRGHGVTVVGASLRQAVYRAAYTETNARLQAQAMQLGPVEYLTDEEGFAGAKTNDGQIDRVWAHWLEMLGKE